MVQSLFGEIEVSAVIREREAEFRALLFGLPSGDDKARRWRGKDLCAVIASAQGSATRAAPDDAAPQP